MSSPITTETPGYLLEQGEYRGFTWEVTHNGQGFRCGYVRIPKGHAWYGRRPNFVDATTEITFVAAMPDGAWWIGFHCMHSWDIPDPELPVDREGTFVKESWRTHSGTVKTTEDVKTICREIIDEALS